MSINPLKPLKNGELCIDSRGDQETESSVHSHMSEKQSKMRLFRPFKKQRSRRSKLPTQDATVSNSNLDNEKQGEQSKFSTHAPLDNGRKSTGDDLKCEAEVWSPTPMSPDNTKITIKTMEKVEKKGKTSIWNLIKPEKQTTKPRLKPAEPEKQSTETYLEAQSQSIPVKSFFALPNGFEVEVEREMNRAIHRMVPKKMKSWNIAGEVESHMFSYIDSTFYNEMHSDQSRDDISECCYHDEDSVFTKDESFDADDNFFDTFAYSSMTSTISTLKRHVFAVADTPGSSSHQVVSKEALPICPLRLSPSSLVRGLTTLRGLAKDISVYEDELLHCDPNDCVSKPEEILAEIRNDSCVSSDLPGSINWLGSF